MIPNEWYAVLESHRVRRDPVGLKRLGQDIVLWRQSSGNVACLIDRCPHRGAKLSVGRVAQGCIECPYHGFLFDAGGACRYVPANGADRPVPKGLHVDSWPVREEHGLIWVWWGESRSEYPPVPWFPQPASDEAHAAESSGVYNFHYARAIENALDAHHFPFIHGSISPNVGTLIDPFKAEFDGETIRVVAGLKRSRSESDEEAVLFNMAFKFPNVFFVRLHDKIRLIQVTTPVDDKSTWAYVRYYQTFVSVPVLGRILSRFLMVGDAKLAQELQDVPVFQTQTPHKPGLDCGYKFIVADRGIYYYLTERQRRIDAAKAKKLPVLQPSDEAPALPGEA
uniref:Rieske (2Fe-2S) domain-containing protein n=1 Tax=Sorangium cellulosum TaxID=56 RepID=F1B9R2_SORCE|nr:Rieske (2Fe-2S) domain-containing protein [Sorangium cellulosum]